jgi:hypothetical protein
LGWSIVIKAISLKQPWATLVITGAKTYETRSWKTGHRGALAIHASRSFSRQLARLCQHEPFRSALLAAGYRKASELPRGMLLGTVELVEVYSTNDMDPRTLPATELAFGDFRPQRFAFKLGEPVRWKKPLPLPGQLNIFDVELSDQREF